MLFEVEAHYIAKLSFNPRPPASAFQVLGLQVCSELVGRSKFWGIVLHMLDNHSTSKLYPNSYYFLIFVKDSTQP